MAHALVFIHGLESSSCGTKGAFFHNRYPGMIIGDFSGTLEQRMSQLELLLAGKKDLIIVGSSYGGLMATLFAFDHPEMVSKLVLLAPALDLPEFGRCVGKQVQMPVELYHGERDEVVKPGPVQDIAKLVFPKLKYHLVDDDHPLTDTFKTYDWGLLLEISQR